MITLKTTSLSRLCQHKVSKLLPGHFVCIMIIDVCIDCLVMSVLKNNWLMSMCNFSDRFLPDKAIDLIDEAGSRVRLRHAQVCSCNPCDFSNPVIFLHDFATCLMLFTAT